MKYWKKLNEDCGTMDDNGFVPDSVEITKLEYDNFVASLSVVEYVEEIVEYEDIETGKIMKLRKVK